MPVAWGDAEDAVIGGDLTAALAYVTPAGGAVVTAVAPIGLRDRSAGTVAFTTSLGFGRKLDRIRNNPRVSLAYHARAHGFAREPHYVLAQGTASFDLPPEQRVLDEVVRPASTRFMGPPKEGFFWDRWLREYYADRILVTVTLERLTSWGDLRCSGDPIAVEGAPLPPRAPQPQRPPRNGTGPRVDPRRLAERMKKLPHTLLAFLGGDGFPVAIPVLVDSADDAGIVLTAEPGLVPPGGRRAGLLAHSYNKQLIGLSSRQATGWLEVLADGTGRYAPHTQSGFKAPANKTLLLLANGLLAKRGLKRAHKASGGHAT